MSAPPANVRAWLERVAARAPRARTVVIEQQGELRPTPKRPWLPFTATYEMEVERAGFRWRARLRIAPLIWVAADDGLRDGRAWGGARLWGVVPMGGRRSGPVVIRSQLYRWLSELPLVPEAAAATADLVWADDAAGFTGRAHVAGEEALVRFVVDPAGDLVRTEAEARPHDLLGAWMESRYVVEYGGHADVGDVRVPAEARATLHLPDGPFEYWRARTVARRSVA